MARVRVRLDHPGVEAVLKSAPVRAEINRLAAQVVSAAQGAPEVQRHGMTVDARSITTDRAASVVAIAHPGGLGVQAKYGTLTQAAGSAGLEVSGR